MGVGELRNLIVKINHLLGPSFERFDALLVPVDLVIFPVEPSLNAFESVLDAFSIRP
jgi:hypothetical protein